jgi:hypothetical protein
MFRHRQCYHQLITSTSVSGITSYLALAFLILQFPPTFQACKLDVKICLMPVFFFKLFSDMDTETYSLYWPTCAIIFFSFFEISKLFKYSPTIKKHMFY